jgi:CRP/FNR family transcriptional regulator, cyclic AMP receptor protein
MSWPPAARPQLSPECRPAAGSARARCSRTSATFEWLLDSSIGFNRYLLVQLNERLGQFIGMVEFERLLAPEARVARCLAELFNPHLYPGHAAEVAISQEEIGYLSGVSRQRVNQALQVLERAGLLQVDYGRIRITDLAGLRSYGG